MGIFGDGGAQEIADLQQRVNVLSSEKKQLGQKLAQAQQRAAELTAEIERMRAEVAKAQRSVQRARQRQKASVARANRFKARLGIASSAAEGL